jgi:hypothetical protein
VYWLKKSTAVNQGQAWTLKMLAKGIHLADNIFGAVKKKISD